MAVAPNDARCQFEYNGAHNNDAAKRRSLGANEGGELKIAAGHTILAAVGHLLDQAAVAQGLISMHLVEYLILEGIFIDNGLDTCHPRWHIRLPALSKLFADLLTAGISSARAETLDDYKARVEEGLKLLPEVDRTLTLAKVLADGTITNSWWDHISPRRLRAGDATNAVLSQLRTMVTGHWNTGSQNNAPFSVALDLMVPTAYVNRTPQVQATAVVAHLRKTAVRQQLTHYISPLDAEDEMGRRVADTEEGAFIPLFEKVWTKAYPELVQMVPACKTAAEVVLIVKGLLTRMHLPTTFTDASVSAFCKTVKPHLPNIQHGLTTAAEQDERIELLMASVGTSGTLQGATKTGDGTATKDAEQWVKVYRQTSFQELNRFLEGNQTLPLDHRKITAGMWKATHVSGWMQLNGTAIPQPAFKAVWGLSAHKGISALHECVNAALARTTDGQAIPNAGTPIAEKIAKLTVAGNVANGTGKNELDWWGEIVQPIVAKRDGIDALGGITTTAVDDFFVDIRKLELSVEILTNWFAMFGYAGTGSGSVNTIIRNILRETKTLTHMRDTEMRKPGLVHNFKAAANGIFKEFSATLRAMLAGPVSAAERSDKVLNSGTPAAAAWMAAIEDIKRVVDEHKLEDAGVGRLQKYQRLDTAGSDAGTASTLAMSALGQRKIGGRGAGSQISTVYPDDSASNAGTNQTTGSVTRGWGDMAAAYGVYFTGDTLAFGNIVTTYAVEIQIPKEGCLAPYAPDASKNKRNSWCTQPQTCKNSDHARAAGLSEEDISTTRTDGGKIDDAWTVLCQPTKKTLGSSNGGRGRGGKGRGGKGKGGKGKGGRFQRQQ